MNAPLVDRFGRRHNYLRVSLTPHCNLRCFYCMPEEDYAVTPSSGLMQAGEIYELAEKFVEMGVDKIRLTGGEPLVRKDAGRIIQSLARLPVTLAMTTNGVRLHQFLPQLADSGIRSVNVSLDTLDGHKFALITRRNHFRQVWDNIHELLEQGIQVKVNVVVMQGLNHTEIRDFVSWTKHVPVHVRFIEFMPFAGNRWSSNQVFGWKQILQAVEEEYSFARFIDEAHETAKTYRVPGHAGSFAVISTMTAPFCSSCNRLRLTADGKLKNCLFSKEETDLLSALRNGEDVEALIRLSVLDKAAERGGQFPAALGELDSSEIQNRSMIAIGG